LKASSDFDFLVSSMEVIMKTSVLVAGAACLALAACASPNEGNPNGAAYAGSPDSVYEASANPPKANGSVSYDPRAPLPADPLPSPSGSTMPAAAGTMPR
jgi:hypothetical protein